MNTPLTLVDCVDQSSLEVPPECILFSYRGSIAHGMFFPKPDSIDDIDYMGIVIPPIENYFGLSEWGSRGTKEVKRGRWDVVYYEIRKMFSLLLQGNPNVLSILWNERPDHLVIEPAAKAMIDHRHYFVGKHVYNAFAGYAHQQLERMTMRDPSELRLYMAVTAEAKYRGIHPNHKGQTIPYAKPASEFNGEERDAQNWTSERLLSAIGSYNRKGENIGYMGDKRKQLVIDHGYDSKNAAHLIRLLRMCVEFMKTGSLTVKRPDAEELLSIKRGEWSLESIQNESARLFALAREERDKSALPEHPDRESANRLLISILEERFIQGLRR